MHIGEVPGEMSRRLRAKLLNLRDKIKETILSRGLRHM
jgi:hypothetical protein